MKPRTIVDLPTWRDQRLILNRYFKNRLIASSWNGHVLNSCMPLSLVLIYMYVLMKYSGSWAHRFISASCHGLSFTLSLASRKFVIPLNDIEILFWYIVIQ
jgi:hypothetical protein